MGTTCRSRDPAAQDFAFPETIRLRAEYQSFWRGQIAEGLLGAVAVVIVRRVIPVCAAVRNAVQDCAKYSDRQPVHDLELCRGKLSIGDSGAENYQHASRGGGECVRIDASDERRRVDNHYIELAFRAHEETLHAFRYEQLGRALAPCSAGQQEKIRSRSTLNDGFRCGRAVQIVDEAWHLFDGERGVLRAAPNVTINQQRPVTRTRKRQRQI